MVSSTYASARHQPLQFSIKQLPLPSDVPDELLLIIFSYLGPRDIVAVNLVCRRFYVLTKHNRFKGLFSAYILAQAVVRTAVHIDDLPRRAKILAELAEFHIRTGDLRNANNMLHKIRELYVQVGGELAKREILTVLGSAQCNIGDHTGSRDTSAIFQASLTPSVRKTKDYVRPSFYSAFIRFSIHNDGFPSPMAAFRFAYRHIIQTRRKDPGQQDHVDGVFIAKDLSALTRVWAEFDGTEEARVMLKVTTRYIHQIVLQRGLFPGYVLSALVDVARAQSMLGDQESSAHTLGWVEETIQNNSHFLYNQDHPACLSVAVAQAKMGYLTRARLTASCLTSRAKIELWATFAVEEARRGYFAEATSRALGMEEGSFKAQALLQILDLLRHRNFMF